MNKTRLRVSIVIPAYNEERHLSACLASVAAQTVLPYEVIVVDNNSSDATADIPKRFPFAVVVDETNQGIVHARNAGFAAAKGDIIGRIDADIQLPPTWVEHVQEFYAEPAHRKIAWTGLGRFYNIPLRRLVNWAYELIAFKFVRLLLGHYPMWGSSMAITAEQWQKVRTNVCLRTDIHEDLDLAMHLHKAGFGIRYDTGIKVWAELRRVQSDRHTLWAYLLWLPRTLRIHNVKTWPLSWLVGTLMIYLAALSLAAADYIIRAARGRSAT